MPFLKVSTIMKLIKICKKKINLVSECSRLKIFINQKNKSINFKKNLRAINTKTVEPLKEFAHCFYFFKKEYFNKKGVFWNWNKVKYINLNKSLEYYDIDDEKDFKTASILAKVMINV